MALQSLSSPSVAELDYRQASAGDSDKVSGRVAETKVVKVGGEKESSSAFFERTRPKFLDWRPPTEEERALGVKARREQKEAELKRVTALEEAREAAKAANRKR